MKRRRQSKFRPAIRRKRVLLVDWHALMRRAAAGWINRSSRLTVCGIAGGRAEALKAVERLHPDIVVSEILQPPDLGFIRELHQRHPRLPILVFTIQEEALYRERAAQAGASGYLMKEAGGEKLVQHVSAVLHGRAREPER
jgi:DNA-binding NarL/FixJ family response regulator